MKRDIKIFITGVIVGTLGVTTVFAAGSGIKSAAFNSNKIIFNGNELDLNGQQLISVVKENETNASNYIPVYGVLTAMGYMVGWDGENNSVIISSTPSPTPVPTPIPTSTPTPTPAPTQTPQPANTPAPTKTPEPTLSPVEQQAADAKLNAKTSLKEGETFIYYKDGKAQYSITVKRAEEEGYAETRAVDTSGNRILQVVYEYENFAYKKDINFSNYKFTGKDDKAYSIDPYTTINGYTQSAYKTGKISKTTSFKGFNGNPCPSGSKSTGKVFYIVGASKTLQVRCAYASYEGMENGVTWDFNLTK